MSTTDDTSDDLEESAQSPEEIVSQHRELFERLADTDLPSAPDFQRALDRVDEARDRDE